MHGRSNRTLDQRQRADSGPKSSSSETSYSFSFSYRHLASTSTGHIGEQIQVARLNSNHNCLSRKHLSKEKHRQLLSVQMCFLKKRLGITGKTGSIPADTLRVCNPTIHLNHSLLFKDSPALAVCLLTVPED